MKKTLNEKVLLKLKLGEAKWSEVLKTLKRPKEGALAGALETLRQKKREEWYWDTAHTGLGIRVSQRGKTWWFRYSYRGKPDKLRLGRYPAMDWTTAKSKFHDLRKALEEGRNPKDLDGLGDAATMTIGHLADLYLKWAALVVGTQLGFDTYRGKRSMIKNHIKPLLGSVLVKDLTSAQVYNVREEIAQTISPSCSNSFKSDLSALLTWAMSAGHRAPGLNPCTAVKLIKQPPRQVYLRAHNYDRVVAHLKGISHPQHAQIALLLCLELGCRKNMIVDCRWSWIERPQGEPAFIRFPFTAHKTGNRVGEFVRHLTPEAEVLLALLPKKGDYLFRNFTGGHCWEVDVLWRQVRAELELGPIHIHDLRSTFASRALKARVPMHGIGALLGHLDPRSTARYAHLEQDQVADWSAQVAAGKPK